MKFNLFLVFLFSLILAGCGSSPTYKTVEVTDAKIVKLEIPKSLTEPCTPDRPYTAEEYLQLKITERESYLTKYSISLLGTIKECNIKLKKIEELTR